MLRRPIDSERGATAIIVASAMLVLLGFAAFAVDISAARNEQRLDQSAVDAAVLAVGVEFVLGGSAQDAVDEILEYVDTNLAQPVPKSDWASCADDQPLDETAADLGLDPPTRCISFGHETTRRFARLRVRLPDRETQTTFGRVLGVEALETSAVAEIEIAPTLEVDLFPAGLPADTESGDTVCLPTATEPSADPAEHCPSVSDIALAFDPGGCNAASITDAMRDGFTQVLGRYAGDERFLCGPNQEPFENTVVGLTEFSVSSLEEGLVEGRLRAPGNGAVVAGDPIDNTPLWTFISPSIATGPCFDARSGPESIDDPAQVPALEAARADMRACLANPPSELFTPTIYESPRLVLVPLLDGDGHILGFAPAYLDSIWTRFDPATDTCDPVFDMDEAEGWCRHDPGRRGTSSQKATSASLIVLSCDALPKTGILGAEKCKTVTDGSGREFTVFFDFALSG